MLFCHFTGNRLLAWVAQVDHNSSKNPTNNNNIPVITTTTISNITMTTISESEYIIGLVRARPCLYDKKHQYYKDSRGVRLNNWTDIAQHMREAGFVNYTGR